MAIFKFFDTVFGSGGTQVVIPDATQPGGQVSFTQGYGPDYTLAPGASGVLYPENGEFNYLMAAITAAIQQWQVHAFPDFIAPSDNGGSAYPYDKNAFVRYTDGNIYISLATANVALPTDTTKWSAFNPFPTSFKTGMMMPYEDVTLPDSTWTWANGNTVGNASSNATAVAGATAQALFTQIWTAFPNAVRPMVDSSGSPVSRGVSAAADWAANRALPVRDMRDVVLAGTATMGGTTNRGLLTGAYTGGVDGSVYGGTGGEQAHTPTLAEMFAHAHNTNWVPTGNSGTNFTSTLHHGGGTSAVDMDTQGSSQPFNVVQPTTIGNWIIKL